MGASGVGRSPQKASFILMSKILCIRTRRFVLRAVILLGIFSGNAAQAQSSITLPEDNIPLLKAQLEAAMLSSPTMIIRQANAAVAMADYKTAISSRYPSLGGWANYLRTEDDRNNAIGGARPATKLGYNFSLRKSLYHWGNIERGIENAKIRTLIDQGNTREAYLTLATNIRRSFFELILGKQQLEKFRFAHEMQKEQLRQAREKQKQNLLSPAEVFRTELDFQRAELSMVESEDLLAHALKVFSRLTGQPVLAESQIPTDFPTPPVEEQEETLVALATRFLAQEMPENTRIQIAKQSIEISENDLQNTKTSLRPRFDLLAGISQDEQDFALDTDSYEYQSIFGGVSLTWNIFDGFATRQRVKAGLARLRASEAELAVQQQTLIDDVQSLGREIKRKAMAIAIQELELKSARSHLEYTQQRAERGEASNAEVNNSAIMVEHTLGNALYARSDYWNKVVQLLSLIEADPILNRAPPLNP